MTGIIPALEQICRDAIVEAYQNGNHRILAEYTQKYEAIQEYKREEKLSKQ